MYVVKVNETVPNFSEETLLSEWPRDAVRRPERVRVCEKIRAGIWSYNGIFHLIDSWTERDENQLVYKFRLEAVEGEEDLSLPGSPLAFWRQIAQHDYAVPPGSDVAALTFELTDMLASPDSELRDDIAYSTLAAWIYQTGLSTQACFERWSTASRAISRMESANAERIESSGGLSRR